LRHLARVLSAVVGGPRLVSPFAGVVIAADVCLDTCVRAGEGRRGGWWPVGSQRCVVVGGPRVATVGAAAVVVE